jgi:hypothetical protein
MRRQVAKKYKKYKNLILSFFQTKETNHYFTKNIRIK